MYYPLDHVILDPLNDWSQLIMTCFLWIIKGIAFLPSTAL